MKIQKIFSSYNEDERLYSVLLNEDELRMFNEYTPGVTKYDRTDKFKAMKDSDILAEKKRSNVKSYIGAAKSGGIGAAIGSGVGAVLGATKFGKKLGISSIKKGAALGAAGGGLLGGGTSLALSHKERQQNRFVNRRLEEAKRQAIRRESKDWKNNAVNREGYTY